MKLSAFVLIATVGLLQCCDNECTNQPDGSPCNDDDACTQIDTCQVGGCVGASPVVCAAPDQCHEAGSCDSGTGQCSSPAKPDGAACSDDDLCTLTDTCQGGVCVGGDPTGCKDQYVVVVRLADDDGSNATWEASGGAAVTDDDIAAMIETANETSIPDTGMRLVLEESVTRNDSIINRLSDARIPACPNAVNTATGRTPVEERAFSFADTNYPGRIVVFIHRLRYYATAAGTCETRVSRGGGFAWRYVNFVSLSPWPEGQPGGSLPKAYLLHEWGHWMGLAHTMPNGSPADLNAAIVQLDDYCSASPQQASNPEMRYDFDQLSDTSPDMGVPIYRSLGGNTDTVVDPSSGEFGDAPLSGPHAKCFGKGYFRIPTNQCDGGTVRISPPRANVMSYFAICPYVDDNTTGETRARFTTEQRDLIWSTLNTRRLEQREYDPLHPRATPQVLASDQGLPRRIALHDAQVYWTNDAGGEVMRMPITGGDAVAIASGQQSPVGLAVDDSGVYWTNWVGGEVMYLPHGASVPTTLATGQPHPENVVVDGSGIYWSRSDGIAVAATISSTPTMLVSGEVSAFAIALDEQHVYWTARGGLISRVHKQGGAVIRLASQEISPRWLAVGEQCIYWTDADGGVLVRMPKAGGARVTLASGLGKPAGIALDDSYVYWTNSEDGSVMRIPKWGGVASTLATEQDGPSAIALNADGVLWVTWRGGTVVRWDK